MNSRILLPSQHRYSRFLSIAERKDQKLWPNIWLINTYFKQLDVLACYYNNGFRVSLNETSIDFLRKYWDDGFDVRACNFFGQNQYDKDQAEFEIRAYSGAEHFIDFRDLLKKIENSRPSWMQKTGYYHTFDPEDWEPIRKKIEFNPPEDTRPPRGHLGLRSK